ncbi:hypothetical protein N8824_03600 [Candidatus Pelagibacter sp.]|nr:hypothetical protein [Candidatus Pelagibacter sp.]
MILNKKKENENFLKIIKKIFSKFIYFTGLISLLITVILISYYYSSGMHERFKPIPLIKKIDEVILKKYLGTSIFEIDDYLKIKLISLKYLFLNNELENVVIKIDQKNLYNLELQRKNKKNNNKNYFVDFSKASLKKDETNYDIKMRIKGDRVLHWYDKDQSSYKIDLRGEKRIWGLEEFSVQKPITRNYIYEYIFHKLLEANKLISLKYFFINLSLNDTDQGIYAVEEGFSKELIERNKKRNGPIFGLEETSGIIYPDVKYDLYSKEYWENNQSELIKIALSKLEKLKHNKTNIGEFFDMEKWAKFFATIDLSNTLHGSLSKSVKLYYNPVTAKFEPIGFDGHHNPNLFKDFLILDFMDIENINCSYMCYDREWYLRFFKNIDGSNNIKFLELYIKALNDISSKEFLNNFNLEYFGKINENNKQLQSEVSKKDLNYYKGLGLYIFDINFLNKRANYIIDRLNKYVKKNINKNNFYFTNNKGLDIISNPNIEYLNGEYYLTKNLIIEENYFLSKGEKLNINKGIKIFFKKDAILFSEGAISFNGTSEKPILVYSDKGYGSLVLSNNSYIIQNTIFQNLSFPKSRDKILYGGVNIINSNLNIKDAEIKFSNSEDAINIISSKSYIKNLTMTDSFADAIDIDFGELVFDNIICENISNDCLDISGGMIEGVRFRATNVNDKGLSFGENSIGSLSDAYFANNKLAIAVKDGSNLFLSKLFLKKNEYDIAIFNKKQEYEGSKVELDLVDEDKIPNILLGKDNIIISNHSAGITRLSNKNINSLLY